LMKKTLAVAVALSVVLSMPVTGAWGEVQGVPVDGASFGSAVKAKELRPVDKELLDACGKGDVNAAMSALTKGADVNIADEGGWTPLALALWSRKIELVKTLLDKGAIVNAPDTDSGVFEAPLVAAVNSGNIETVKLLIERGAKPESSPSHGISVVDASLVGGSVEILEALKGAGAKLTLDQQLAEAIIKGDSTAAGALITKGADPNAQIGFMPLTRLAKFKGGQEMLDLLVKAGARPLLDYEFEITLEKGDIEAIRAMIKGKLDVNAESPINGETALMVAARKENVEVLTRQLSRAIMPRKLLSHARSIC